MVNARRIDTGFPLGTDRYDDNTAGVKSENVQGGYGNNMNDNECFIHPIGEKCKCNCKILDIFSVFGKRHTLPIIRILLLKGTLRFNEIARYVKSNPRTLSIRLKELESKGLVIRKVYNEMPLRVEYSLTDAGKALHPIFREINKWANRWVKNAGI